MEKKTDTKRSNWDCMQHRKVAFSSSKEIRKFERLLNKTEEKAKHQTGVKDLFNEIINTYSFKN